jgi:hypothetical protein
MKRSIVLAAFALSFLLTIFISPDYGVNAEIQIDANCRYNGIKLHGKVQIVENFADITVKPVEEFADLLVQKVSNSADECGQWQIVENFADLKVKFVDSFEDITVKMVESFPGLP